MQPAAWHGIEADEALLRLNSLATGLTTAAAQQRMAEHGLNIIPETRRRSFLIMLLGQFAELIPFHFSRRYMADPQAIYDELNAVCLQVVAPASARLFEPVSAPSADTTLELD